MAMAAMADGRRPASGRLDFSTGAISANARRGGAEGWDSPPAVPPRAAPGRAPGLLLPASRAHLELYPSRRYDPRVPLRCAAGPRGGRVRPVYIN